LVTQKTKEEVPGSITDRLPYSRGLILRWPKQSTLNAPHALAEIITSSEKVCHQDSKDSISFLLYAESSQANVPWWQTKAAKGFRGTQGMKIHWKVSMPGKQTLYV
jgi:hypothetical protein